MSLVNSILFFGTLILGWALGVLLRVRDVDGVAGAGVRACLAVQFAFAVGLLMPSFAWTNQVLLGVVGLGVLEFLRTRGWRQLSFSRMDVLGLAFAGALFSVSSLFYVMSPLYFWDARSIWFFHAKIIFYGEKILSPELWSHSSLSWSHVHYPKLNAFLSADVMRTFGFWNEHLPKLSLSLLTLPALLLALGFSRSLEVRLLIVIGCIMRQGIALGGGYMDSFVAVYAGITAMYAGRFALCGGRGDLLAAVSAIGILSGLKQEGAFIGASIVGASALTMVVSWGWRAALKGMWLQGRSNIGVIFVLFAPYVIWSVFKSVGKLGDYFLKQGSPLERISSRIGDGTSVSHVLTTIQTAFFDSTSILLCSVVGLFILYGRGERSRRFTAASPGLCGAVFYMLILLAVYLSTPFDMNWHVASSIDRTIMALKAMFFGAVVAFVEASAHFGKVGVLMVPRNSDGVGKKGEFSLSQEG